MSIVEIINYLEISEKANLILELLKKVQGEEYDSILNSAINGNTGDKLKAQAKALADKLQINEYTLGLVAIISLAEKTEKMYVEKGCEESFFEALHDVKQKIQETKKWYGVFGVHNFGWEADFFCFKTLAMGRLEFSAYYFTDYEYNGIVKINKGDRVLSVHIPSGRKLDIEECYKSLKRAFKYFKEVRIGKYMPVILTNWFLYPPFEQLFSPDGNLIKFKNLFDVIGSEDYPDYNRIGMRVFDTLDVSNIDALPQDTSLRKKFVKWIKDKKPCGYGIGYLLFDGEKVVTGKKV